MNDKIAQLEEIKNIGIKVLDMEEDRNKHIERKSEIILGFLGIIIPLMIFVTTNVLLGVEPKYYCTLIIFKTLAILISISLLISAILALIVLNTRKFYCMDINRIKKKELNDKKSSLEKVKTRLFKHICDIYNNNKIIINSKAKILKYSLISLIIGLG